MRITRFWQLPAIGLLGLALGCEGASPTENSASAGDPASSDIAKAAGAAAAAGKKEPNSKMLPSANMRVRD